MTTKPTKLSPQKMKKIREFLDPIHKFKVITQEEEPDALAQVNTTKNTLLISTTHWAENMKTLSSYNRYNENGDILPAEKAILLHEVGHIKCKHGDLRGIRFKKYIRARRKEEIQANEWGMSYALNKNWQDVYRAFIRLLARQSILNKWAYEIDKEEIEVYCKSAKRLIKKIKKCEHPNFDQSVLKWMEKENKKLHNEIKRAKTK